MHGEPAGVSLGYWQDRDPLEALTTAEVADGLGYGSLWLGEMATFDVFALATAVGLRTSSIPLTIGPLAAAVRDPAGVAMGVASVAALTGRQVDVALGSSSAVVVRQWHGRPYERLARTLAESASALRPLLAGERSAYAGDVHRSTGYRLRLPAPGASITVAAFGPRSVEVAAQHGDRMVINLCTPALAARLRADVDAATTGAGRERIPLAAWVPAAVDPSPEAVDQLRRALVSYLAAPGYDEMFDRAGFGDAVTVAKSGAHPRDVLAAVPAELVEAVAVIGDEAACRHRLGDFADAGVDQIVLVPATAGDDDGRRTLTSLAPRSAPARS